MVNQDQFFRYVAEVFAHLDDRPFLLTHPLPALLVAPGQSATPETLRRALLGAIEQLRPPEGTPAHLANWRRWRHLTLRYVSGLPTKQIASQLAISERQARRDHEDGIRSVAVVLWGAYVQRSLALQRNGTATPRSLPDQTADAHRAFAFEDEVAQLAFQQPGESTDLSDAIESALATIHSLAHEQPTRVDVSIPDDICPVAASPSLIRQVLLCVLTAATQADPAGSIQLAATNETDAVRLTIQIGASLWPSAGPVRSDDQALLITAQQMVEAEGGTISVDESEPGAGRLVLRLPSTPARRVLVVDDNPDVAQLFRRFLAGSPYRVIQARTPSTGLALARELRPDVIILDVLMPSQDGWQILQQLRTDPISRGIPVIVCSILPERPLAVSLAAVDFLAKPVMRQSLLTALERCQMVPDPAERPGFPAGTS